MANLTQWRFGRKKKNSYQFCAKMPLGQIGKEFWPKSMVRQSALPSCRLHCTAVCTTMIRLHYPNYTCVDYEGSAWTLTTWDGPYLRTCQEIPYPLVGLVYSSKHTNDLESHCHSEAVVVWFFRQVRVSESFDLLAQFEGNLEFEF